MPRPVRLSRPAPEPSPTSGPSAAWPFVVGLLLAARFLQPTEAAVFGETLWQAQLWLVAAAVWCWRAFRAGRETLRLSPLDALLGVLVVGHAVSTLPVLIDGGDRRAAVNVVWEWAGLAATLFLVRQVFAGADVRRPLIAFAGVAVALAALGIWQHHVSFPQTATRYENLTATEKELAERVAAGDASPAERARLAEARRELAEFGVPTDPAARRQWENRVKFSTEPFATFGLANTLGGLLTAAVPLLVALLWQRRRRGDASGAPLQSPLSPGSGAGGEGRSDAPDRAGVRSAGDRSGARDKAAAITPLTPHPSPQRRGGPKTAADTQGRRGLGKLAGVGLVASAGVVLYCLLLTQSRTAWVGLLAGAAAGLGLYFARGRVSRGMAGAIAVAATGVVLLGPLLVPIGGLDREIFSGPLKSLQYRFDYWTGAIGVLSERPLLGTGPANFRTYYLEHRPVGASEEVAAPHNLFLDVWAAGGLPSLLALLGFVGYVAYRLLRADRGDGTAAGESGWTALETGAAAAFPVVVAAYFLAGDGIDGRLLAIWPAAVLALFCLTRSNAAGLPVVAAGAGFVALVVHLLGADGIEFPAVVQTLLLLSAVADRPRDLRPGAARLAPTVLFGGLALGCLLTGLAPALNAGALTARAERLIAAGDPAADRALAEAAAKDPLALRPLALRAELATSRALSSGSAADREAARRRWGEVLKADPRNLHARRRLADLLLARPGEDGRSAAEAAERLSEAVRLSPTDVSLHARLAQALKAAGQPSEAADAAVEALRLDDLNHAALHLDQLLDEATRAELERLAGVGNAGRGP